MNKGNSVVSGGVAVDSVVYTSSGQYSSTDTITSAKLSSNHVTATSNNTDCVNSSTTTPTRITFHSSSLPTSSMIVSTLSSLTTTSIANSTKTNLDNVDYNFKYVDKESKSKLRSNISRFMDYSAFMNSPQFTETMKNQLLMNGTSSSYLNHDACAAQVRTIMKAAGLMPEKVSNRSKLKTSRLSSSSNYANPTPPISLNKMTLMAELFASDEDDADDVDEIYEDHDQVDIADNDAIEHLNNDEEDAEYDEDDDDDDEDDDEEEELNGDGGDEGDDEEENSEVESFTLEDESSLDPKFLLSVDTSIENYQSGLFKNDIELHFSDVPETLSSTSANVDVDQFTDSQLYHELQFASSDVHCVLDEVGATIAKMRISDNNQMPYLVHKLQEEVLQASTNRSNFNADMDIEHVCRNFKPTTAQQCHVPSSHYSLQSVNEEDVTNSDDNQDGAVSVGEEIEESVPLQYPLEELQRKDADKLLLYAAASGHFDMVKLLLSTQKININKRGVKEMTPLMEAASGGFLNTVKILIKHGADVNCKTLQGNSALMYACAMGHLEIVKELIAHDAYIEDQNENGHTSLMEAASAGHVEVARYLVNQGCNINVHSNEYKETALTLAAYKGHLEMVRFLTEAGAGQEHRAEEMHTALMEASMDGHVEVARLLIDSGAQVNMPPDSFESPLTLAACGGHVELALLLLQRGANIEEVNDEGYTALMEAAREGHEEMVALLISHGAQVNATTEESKETALFMACGAGCADVVNLLIKAGADIELGTNTPLMEAAQEGHFEIVKKLLDSNAIVNGSNSSGETALTLAAENGHTSVVKLLISVGADVNKSTDGGRTALMKAAQSGHTETVILLITSKANVNCATVNNDSTALSLACAGGHSQIVEILLNSGADLCHRLKDNSTMLIEAARGGYTNIVQMLIDYHFYKSSGFVQQMYSEADSGLSQSQMNSNQLPQSIQHHHQPALQSKSPISLPPSKLFKHVLSASTTSSSPQPLSSNIKLANNTTLKIYPRQTTSKMPNENDLNNFKFVRGKLVRIPQNKKSTSSSQTNIKQLNQQSPSQVIKSTRSLSDSFIHKSLSIDSIDSNDLSLPHTASVGTNTSISLTNSLPEQFIRQCETLGKENSDISDQIAASIFFTIFRHFMIPETNQPFLSDEQVLNELIDDISEILESNLLDDSNREWLESRFEMIEEFKKHQFCDKKLNQTIPITNSTDNENDKTLNEDFDAIVPGLVLQKFLNNKKTRQKFQIDSSEWLRLRSLFSTCASNKNNNSELLQVEKEIQLDNLSEDEILVGLSETIYQDSNDSIDSDNLKKFDSFVESSNEEKQDNSVFDHNYPTFVAERNTKVFKLNPEQIIYGIKNGNTIPIKYLDDALFEVFKKMSLCFISSNKEESIFDLLDSIKKLPPKLQTTMLLPLFSVAQSRLQELGFDITMFDQSLTSNLSYQSSKLEGFLGGDPSSQDVNDMSNFFLDETIENEDQDNEIEDADDDSNIDMSVFDSFPAVQPYSVASLLTSYQNELLASENQVFELNDNLTVNAATLPPLSSEQLHILKNQFVAAGIFASSAANTTSADDILLNCLSSSNANCSISSATSLSTKADETSADTELHTNNAAANELPCISDTFSTELTSSAAAVELMTTVFSSLSAAKDEDKFEILKEKINALANPYYRNIIEGSFHPENNLAENSVEQPNETSDNSDSPQHVISFPGAFPDTPCSIGSLLSNTPLPQGFVSFPEKFDFNFASSLFNQDSLLSNLDEGKGKRNINAKTKNMDLLNRLKSLPDIFKAKKATPIPFPVTPPVQATAATVSINTNTTATATTAVCVGTLIPQSNQVQVTETTTIAQSQPQSQMSPNSASMPSFTATTKSITKLKNAVGHQSKIDQGQVQQQQSQQSISQPHPLTYHPSSNNTKMNIAAIDVNSQTDSNHESCLTVACANGNEELVKLLLSRGADIELREKKGLTPLMLAATNGYHKIVDILFAHGADLEAQTERTKDTALSLACSTGRYEVVEILLTRGANKEHRNVSDYTPLSLAASGGYVMVIKLLLSYGAEINSRTGSKLGISPLMLAAMNGHTSTVRLLLDRGSDINAYIETNRNTALTLACFQGRTEVVNHLLDRNANIEHRAKTGLTPLMEAASGGYVEVGRVLLDMGADVNAPPVPTSRDTALTIAADKGHDSFVNLLIQRGALVDVKNKKGYSPLWLACNGGHFEVIQHLVAAKCDCDAQDNRKISCLMAAFRKGHVKVVKYLVRHVTQFPSDQEIDRCLALCTDEELHKKALVCSEIVHQAKERQAAEAFKNAANLLEEIDMERSREENRKAAAARRRERRKQKKKEKIVHQKPEDETDSNDQPEKITDQDSNFENEIKIEDSKQCDTSLKSNKKKKKSRQQTDKKANIASVNDDENEEDDDTTAFTIDDEDYESFDDELIEVYEDVPIMKLIADMVTKADLKKKSKKKSKKSKDSNSSETRLQQQSPIVQLKKQSESQLTPTTQLIINHADSKDLKVSLNTIANNKKNKASKTSTISEVSMVTSISDTSKTSKDFNNSEAVIEKVKPSSVKSNTSVGVKSIKNAKKQLEELPKTAKLSDNLTKISDVDSDSLHDEPNMNDTASSISTSSTQSTNNRNVNNQQFRSKTTNKSSTNSSNTVATHNNSNVVGGNQIKREEGWKEVVRKSKKVQVPANAISRVIGRGGCNINTIREISGAHIEVEKQKGQGNRMVNIRGSADSTRYAQQLITALSKEAEKDLSEIIRELGLENLQPPTSSAVPVTAISTVSVSTPIDSMATVTTSVPVPVESLESSLLHTTQPSNSQSTTFLNSSSRQTFKSAPNRLASSKSQPAGSGTVTVISTSQLSTSTSSGTHSVQLKLSSKQHSKSLTTTTTTAVAAASNASSTDSKQSSQTSSSTSNTVSYTMAVNSKTRNTNTSSSSSTKSNGVKIMSAVYKPSNKSQIHSNNNYGSNRNNHQQTQNLTNSANEVNNDSTLHSTNNSANNSDANSNAFASSKSNVVSVPNLPSTEAEYSQFNPSYSNIWSKSNEKPNFTSIAASVSTSTQSMPFSNISQKQSVEIIVDENKAPGFNRHFVSPGSFSTSSSSSFNGPLTTLSINTSTNSGPVQSNVHGPIGSVRSAPCTPPISNCSNFSRVNKYNNQQQVADLSNANASMEPVLSISVSKSQMDSYMPNTSEMYSPSLLTQQHSLVSQANSHQSNMFYNTSSPSIVSDDSPTKYYSSNNGGLNGQSMYNASFNRSMGFMEMPSAPFYGSDQQISKPSIRSNLNPNAPDFASRSNSLSTNSLPQQPSMNHASSANSLINGSNSSIPSTGFNNVPNVVIPNRPYLTGSAPPISNTAVRAAIVNYSMNLFQNQVPKQHQEAAARLAHLSAQNTLCTNVGNEFQNAFIANNNGNTINNNGLNAPNANPNNVNLINGQANSIQDNMRMIQYMYQTLKQQPPSGANPNCNSFSGQQSPASMSNYNPASQFGGVNRTIVSSNTSTTYSGPNFANSSESLSLTTTTSTSNMSYTGSGLLNATNSMPDHLIENSTQRVKPAPIGTERAQRKNPIHGFGPSPQPPNSISNHMAGMNVMNNSAPLNSNSLLADQALPWNISSNSDPILSNSADGVPFGASLVGSDYSDFLDRSSLSHLNQMDYNMISHRHPMQQQQRFNSLNMMDGSFAPAFANSNQMANSFKGITNNNLNESTLFPPTFSNIITTNIDSDYWSSSASSSSSITKQTPNCSTSGNNPVYETKLQWNNWN